MTTFLAPPAMSALVCSSKDFAVLLSIRFIGLRISAPLRSSCVISIMSVMHPLPPVDLPHQDLFAGADG